MPSINEIRLKNLSAPKRFYNLTLKDFETEMKKAYRDEEYESDIEYITTMIYQHNVWIKQFVFDQAEMLWEEIKEYLDDLGFVESRAYKHSLGNDEKSLYIHKNKDDYIVCNLRNRDEIGITEKGVYYHEKII